jgi:oxygen-independent coproporphyrinogen III oxidase
LPADTRQTAALLQLIGMQQELSLYVHIPYCTSKCAYCSFFSSAAGKHFRPEQSPVLMRILAEVRTAAAVYGRAFKTLYIGGGDPGLAAGEVLDSILEEAARFGRPREISIETNPESVTPELLKIYHDGRADRLSIGAQSFSAELLARIGRNTASPKTVRDVLTRCTESRSGWALNVDLIHGIPGQTLTDALADIDEVVKLAAPEHISLYELTLEEGTPLHSRFAGSLAGLRDESADFSIALMNRLRDLGFRQYEVSNYACAHGEGATDYRCLHNLQYWRMRPYLGIGPSAASTLYGEGAVYRIEAAPTVDSLNAEPFSAGFAAEQLSPLEFLQEMLLMGLRSDEGIDESLITGIFSVPADRLFPRSLSRLCREGLLQRSAGSFRTTRIGLLQLNALLVDLFIELDDTSHLLPDSIDLTAVFQL